MTVAIAYNELSELEQMASDYSDFYKEAYGFRPRNNVSGWTVDDYREEFRRLSKICEGNNKQRKADERQAIDQFEALVLKLVKTHGVKDRATAIRHLAEAEGAGHDMEYFCYCMGLPYGYFA